MVKVSQLSSSQLGKLKETLETGARAKRGKQCKKGKPCGGSCITQSKTCGGKAKAAKSPKVTKTPTSNPKSKVQPSTAKKPVKPKKIDRSDHNEVIAHGAAFTAKRLKIGQPSVAERRAEAVMIEKRDSLRKQLSNPDSPEFAKANREYQRAEKKYYSEKSKREAKDLEKFDKLKSNIMKVSGVTDGDAKKFISSLDIPESIRNRQDFKDIEDGLTEAYKLTGGRLDTLKSLKYDDDRASANEYSGTINVGRVSNDRRAIMLHEAGHHFEASNNREMTGATNTFILSRSTSSTPKPLSEITGHRGYGADELAYPDHFISHYVGKVYSDGGTEVISMGLERFSDRQSMSNLYREDPDHFNLIVGFLTS